MTSTPTRPGAASPATLTVGVLGAGTVGRTLARAWALSGHQIILGSRQPGHRRMADAAGDIARGTAIAVTTASHRDAARNADVVAVTVPGDQVQALLGQLGGALRGQLVIDATNDISPGAPVLNNLAVLRAAGAICFRAFNTVGWEQMARPVFGQLRADRVLGGSMTARERHDTGGQDVLRRAGDASALILTSLAGGSKHGYALIQDIKGFTGLQLGPGTLYGALDRLERMGLIEALPAEDRRQPYRITAAGVAALRAHLDSIERVSSVGRLRLGLGGI